MVKRKLLLHFIDAGLENFALGVKSHDAPDVGLGFERSLHEIGFDRSEEHTSELQSH